MHVSAAATIFALSSGSLPAGVAIVRISGPGVRAMLERMAGGIPVARKAVVRTITNGDGEILDRCLVLYFEAPASFTGEDCAELHLHGGRAVTRGVLSALAAFPDFRMAEAGEFTRRAFINGKLDLTAAEALGDLIAAGTAAERRLALENASGGQRRLYAGWREKLIGLRAFVEADLDFSDEGDVPEALLERTRNGICALIGEMEDHLAGYRRAEIVKEGFRVALAGPPNAGKSSLLNRLAKRDAAIVSELAGTTRDVIELELDLDGIKIVLTDTAGLRESDDPLERMGIERARSAIQRADLVLHLTDARMHTTDSPDDLLPELFATVLSIGTKSDLLRNEPSESAHHDLLVSAVTGKGIASLLDEIGRHARAALGDTAQILPSKMRHVLLLQEAVSHLRSALDFPGGPVELVAEELRLASNALGRLTGAIDVEDLLDEIFSRFCIGK